MSLWKFLNPKHKKERITQKEEHKDTDQSVEGSPAFDRQRNRHQMSVSRSGRYKQKHRKRCGILDNPDFVNNTSESGRENTPPENTPKEIASDSDNVLPYLLEQGNLKGEPIRESCQNVQISAL